MHRCRRRSAAVGLSLLLGLAAPGLQAQPASGLHGVGTPDRAPSALVLPLTDQPGEPERGRAIVASRQTGLCLLCHSGPFEPTAQQGNLASNLAGVGRRWTAAQLRLRIVNARRIDPDSLMPPFHDPSTQQQVARPHAGQPILSAQQVEDVVAFLMTLTD
jgi:sulfur-oxidizing protein SoxX